MVSKLCSVFRKVNDPICCTTMPILSLVTSSAFKNEVLRYRESQDKGLKENLYAFSPSGIFSRRSTKYLLEPSNVICIDIDGKDNPSISNTDEMKQLIKQLKFVCFCGVSVGGKGVYCLISYKDHTKHKAYFKALQKDFQDIGLVIDKGCSDICRLRIVSYDPEPYLNLNAEIYDKILEDNLRTVSSKVKLSIMEPQERELSLEKALLIPSDLDSVNLSPFKKSQSKDIDTLLKKVISLKIDITQNYNDWFKIGCIIKDIYGSEGRLLFHGISQFYPDYSEEECDEKWESIIKGYYHFKYEFIMDLAKRYGVV